MEIGRISIRPYGRRTRPFSARGIGAPPCYHSPLLAYPAAPVVPRPFRRPATFDWEILRDGLLITGTGMGVVFVVLTILLVGTGLITRVDLLIARRAAGMGNEEEAPAGPAEIAPAGPPPDVVAAISVALAMAEDDAATHRAAIGASPQTPSGQSQWVAAGRRAAMEGGARVRR